VSFLVDLRSELARNGIRGRLADRIVAEFADHLACDPHALLGAPAEIAERFATELRIARTRRASLATFAALALCAGLLVAAGAQQSPGNPFAGLALVGFGQIAFVAGTLALVRGLRGRTPGDLRLAQRRATVALAAGAGVAAGFATEGRTLTYVCAALALPAVALAARSTRRAAALTPAVSAPGLSADLPGPLRGHPGLVLFALGAVAVAGIFAQGVVFEGSGWEGVMRGAMEAGGLAAGVVVFGRLLGLRR
jgi:hypothetical protein